MWKTGNNQAGIIVGNEKHLKGPTRKVIRRKGN